MARRVQVVVAEIIRGENVGKWIAFCREPGCTWTHSPHPKTYIEQRARAHRAEHRKAADRA